MDAKNYQVLASSPLVLLAMRTDFEEIADLALFESLLEEQDVGSEAHLVGDDSLEAGSFCQGEQFVSLLQGLGYRFFQINMGAGVECRHGHGMMLIGPARCYGNKVRLFPGKHLTIIRVLACCTDARGRFGPAGFVRIGYGYNLDILAAIENEIMFVAIIAMTSVANDCRPKFSPLGK